MLLDAVFQYRTLVGKCDLGLGLDWDEIEQLDAIEGAFAPSAIDRSGTGRRFRREPTKLAGLMRGDRIHDRVEIIEMGPGGLVCRKAPYVARGEVVELVIEVGDESLRFSARGVWLKDDGDDYRVGFELVGMPVRLRTIALASSSMLHDDGEARVSQLVEQIAA